MSLSLSKRDGTTMSLRIAARECSRGMLRRGIANRGIQDQKSEQTPLLQKRKVKGRPLRVFPFSPDASAMALDNALYGSKADAQAGKIGGRVKPLKRDE